MPDPLLLAALALATLAAVGVLAVAVGRARRWGARCPRCDWTSLHLTRTRAETAALQHRPTPECDVRLWQRTDSDPRRHTR